MSLNYMLLISMRLELHNPKRQLYRLILTLLTGDKVLNIFSLLTMYDGRYRAVYESVVDDIKVQV